MRLSFVVVLLCTFVALPAGASEVLKEFLWTNRPIVVFADSTRDPRFIEQVRDFESRTAELDERDVVLLYDTEPEAKSPLRLRLRPRGFQIVLIGKDGEIKLRSPHPTEADALIRLIDRMPLRRNEIRGGQN